VLKFDLSDENFAPIRLFVHYCFSQYKYDTFHPERKFIKQLKELDQDVSRWAHNRADEIVADLEFSNDKSKFLADTDRFLAKIASSSAILAEISLSGKTREALAGFLSWKKNPLPGGQPKNGESPPDTWS
jgi:hypothetical protein